MAKSGVAAKGEELPGSFANIGAKEYLAEFSDREGILFVGKAQEKAYVVRTITKKHPMNTRSGNSTNVASNMNRWITGF